jgi:hypothetical protein
MTLNASDSACSEAAQLLEQRLEEDRAYFASIKNKYAGRRGFVIGNGPSLTLADLEKLNNEITLAANKVYLAFPSVSWRPTYITVADPLLWEKINYELCAHVNFVHLPAYLSVPDAIQARTRRFQYLGNASALWRKHRRLFFSADFGIGAYGGYTVTYENLQLAVHLGLNPIYIVGCDHFYKGEPQITANQPLAAIASDNHFLPDYRQVGEIVNPAPLELMNESFQQAHAYCRGAGIELFNATRGGYLEVFERRAFDDLF